MNSEDLEQAVRRWMQTCPDAGVAADWLITRAGRGGSLPARLRVDRFPEVERALTALLSDRYLTGTVGHARHVRLADYEQREVGQPGALLLAVASATGKHIENRRAAEQELERAIVELLSPSSEAAGVCGRFIRRELEAVVQHRGRVWRRAVVAGIGATAIAVRLHLRLLDHVQSLADRPGTIERLADVSRAIAGDTHWLRPGTEAWRDLSDDLLDLSADSDAASDARTPEDRAAALREAGLVENLTSIAVLVYGPLRLRLKDACWSWLEEAVEQRMPVWLSAAHLEGAAFESSRRITHVITVENETSFHDLMAASGRDSGTVVVLTAGHPNRSVIKTLRLLGDAFPQARFTHQGDLDLAGVRILASLRRRCGLEIAHENMDAATHCRLRHSGIRLGKRETEELEAAMRRADLPCRDLLVEILASGVRIEQENITDAIRRSAIEASRPDPASL